MIRLPWSRLFQAKPCDEGAPRAARPGNSADASKEPDTPLNTVYGERAAFVLGGARSLQSRMPSLLAAGLMIGVGTSMLVWYYARALSRPAAARGLAHASLPDAAGESMSLPPFGPIASSRDSGSALEAPSVPVSAAEPTLPLSANGQSSPAVIASLDPLRERPLDRVPEGLSRDYAAPQPSARQRALDRRLSGPVFAGPETGTPSNATTSGGGEGPARGFPAPSIPPQASANGARGEALEALLRPIVRSSTLAQILPTRRLLLPKGAFIDCTLETAIDSTLPGMTTCVTADDTFGADGAVVLLERGTKLIGETRGEVQQGQARVFVVWTEARTPSGVVVRLDSPGTDPLGRSGLDGEVNRHFWQRFGAAALVSTIGGLVQSEVQSSSHGATVVLNPTASEDVLTEILRSTISIPPTIRVRNGARIQVLVARDIDFRPVYELEPR